MRPTALGTSWRTVVFKEQPGYYAYSLYASTGTGVPSGNAMIAGTDRDVRAASALTANTWTHLAATYDGTVLADLRQRRAVGAAARGRLDRDVDRRAEDRRQQHLARGLPGADRRGADLQPRAVAGRDPGGHERERRQPRHRSLRRLRPASARPARSAPSRSRGLPRRTTSASPATTCTARPRPASPPSAANRIAQPTGTSYTDAGLAAGTYYYRVIAEDAAGNVSPRSNEASATVTGDVVAPTGSGTLTATAGARQRCARRGRRRPTTWRSTRYNVHRSTTAGFTPDRREPDRAADRHAATRDPGLAAGTYYYRVTAEDAAGNVGAASPQASATVTTAPPVGLVAAYSFDQGSGTVLTDLSGNGNNGAISGADVDRGRQVRRRAHLRRRQRHRQRARREQPRSHDRDDARSLGAADGARHATGARCCSRSSRATTSTASTATPGRAGRARNVDHRRRRP